MRPDLTRGFTLIELLLVLGLLVIVGALVAPVVASILDYQRLSRGAEQVRTGMMQARLEAMRSGRPQVFQCTIGGGSITIQPWVDPADATEAADMAGMVGTSGFASVVPVTTGGGTTIELPEGITCKGVQVENTLRSELIMTSTMGATGPTLTSAVDAVAQSPATPVVFYPDGTATDAIVDVTGDAGTLQMRLRGMTGDITLVEGGG